MPPAADSGMDYLFTEGREIGGELSKLGDDHAALFEVAVKSNILLVIYKPEAPTTQAIGVAIEKAGERAKLPEKSVAAAARHVGVKELARRRAEGGLSTARHDGQIPRRNGAAVIANGLDRRDTCALDSLDIGNRACRQPALLGGVAAACPRLARLVRAGAMAVARAR